MADIRIALPRTWQKLSLAVVEAPIKSGNADIPSRPTTLEAFVDEWYGPAAFANDPRDLGAMFATWRAADISSRRPFDGDFLHALGSLRARAVVMPCRSDTYFPPEDSEIEVRHMPHAELRVIPSDWGHAAGAGVNAPGNEFIASAIREILELPAKKNALEVVDERR